jgi:hypothetical protein
MWKKQILEEYFERFPIWSPSIITSLSAETRLSEKYLNTWRKKRMVKKLSPNEKGATDEFGGYQKGWSKLSISINQFSKEEEGKEKTEERKKSVNFTSSTSEGTIMNDADLFPLSFSEKKSEEGSIQAEDYDLYWDKDLNYLD